MAITATERPPRWSVWLPITMSAAALALLLGYVASLSLTGQPVGPGQDEGTAAHLFQILMAGQAPVIGYLLLAWLPRRPAATARILAMQAAAALVPFAVLYRFEH